MVASGNTPTSSPSRRAANAARYDPTPEARSTLSRRSSTRNNVLAKTITGGYTKSDMAHTVVPEERKERIARSRYMRSSRSRDLCQPCQALVSPAGELLCAVLICLPLKGLEVALGYDRLLDAQGSMPKAGNPSS